MNRTWDLSQLQWTLAGYMPESWLSRSMEMGMKLEAEVAPIPCQVPGSVQQALREAGILPDWNEGLNSRACEWVENRDWVFTAMIPDDWITTGERLALRCGGLDGPGLVIFNRQKIGEFANAFVPHTFDLTDHTKTSGNELHIIFTRPPRWLGQVGYTSKMTDWKPRFNYTWDWMPRLVQIGPWAPMQWIASSGPEIGPWECRAQLNAPRERCLQTLYVQPWDSCPHDNAMISESTVFVRGHVKNLPADTTGWEVHIELDQFLHPEPHPVLTIEEFARGVTLEWPRAERWRLNTDGKQTQKLHKIICHLVSPDSKWVDKQSKKVGFRQITWTPCKDAPAGADPWICNINGKPVFLQGVNWTPMRPFFADLTERDYRKRISQYASMGCNLLRVWGGGFPEHDWFYDLCDEYGILVWQEFPLSSSGHENWPPESEPAMTELVEIGRSYIQRLSNHPSLLMWCGGNELQGSLEGAKTGVGKPVTMDHPLMQRWASLVDELDPDRRFVPSSSSGPRFTADARDFGKGLHWDVHGPWRLPAETVEASRDYWQKDDALFRSEAGAPGAAPAELIRKYAGQLPVTPGTLENPLWRRFSWWLQWNDFTKEMGREPVSLEEFVTWSQQRQADALALAVQGCKDRFPGIGGIILWMGHDSFPCATNTSIIDFDGKPKPAAKAVAAIWLR